MLTFLSSTPKALTRDQALQCVEANITELMASATRYREHYFGKSIELCAIINARSGHCTMDCAFCAQSKHHESEIEQFSMLEPRLLHEKIVSFFQYPVSRVGIVTSGGALSTKDVQIVIDVLKNLPKPWQERICASLGKLQDAELSNLQQAGLTRYHHNLECGEAYYKKICSTQTWIERVNTIKRAHSNGLQCCAGGLFGLGENFEQRIDFAFALKELGVKNVPINFLQARQGTPLANVAPLEPNEALRIIAIFRHILPDATLRICGGRFHVLGKRQGKIFAAGANALMTGDYLTTKGQGIEDDCRLIAAQGLQITI